jgi:hypothetical protein
MAAFIGLPEVSRFRWLMDRYGSAIEADLRRVYQVDVLDVFRDKLSIRTALNLIDRLPRASHLRHEMAQDEDLARLQMERADPAQQIAEAVPFTEWTPETELLTYIGDVIAEQLAVLIAVNSDGQMKRAKPLPRPSRAYDRLVQEASDRAYQELLDLLGQGTDKQ